MKLASNLIVDAVVPGDDLRAELIRRFDLLGGKIDSGYPRRRAVPPM